MYHTGSIQQARIILVPFTHNENTTAATRDHFWITVFYTIQENSCKLK